MRSKPALALISIAAVALGACTSGASPSVPTATPAATQIAVATLTASAVPVESTSPTTLIEQPAGPELRRRRRPADAGSDRPVQPAHRRRGLDGDRQEAERRRQHASSTRDRVCTFKSGLTEVKMILAPPAPDAATAQAYWDQARSEIPADIPIKDLSYFDRSAYGSGSAGGSR